MIGRTFLLAVCICIVQAGYSQILKGTIMAGGTIGFSYSQDHEDQVNTGTFSFTPLIGGFISRNFVLGVAPLVQYTASSGTVIDSPVTIHIFTSTFSLGIGPYARYYIRLAPKLYLYIHGSPSIMGTWNKTSSDPSNPVMRTTAASWVVGPGLSIMAVKNIAVELALYYHGIYHRSAQYVNGNLLGNPGRSYVDHGVLFNVGFQVYFDRDKKVLSQPAN